LDLLKEVTLWETDTPNHTYLLDGDKLVGYLKRHELPLNMLKIPMRFDRRYRKFETIVDNPFQIEDNASVKIVKGSKGQTYKVNLDEGTCNCPGFRFRGDCKHVH
jgi:hypothetical protein